MPFGFFKKAKDASSSSSSTSTEPAPEPAKKTLVCLDFDGLFADSLQHIIDSINQIAAEKGVTVSLSNYADILKLRNNALRELGVKDAVKMAASQTDLTDRALKLLAEKIDDTPLLPGMRELVSQLQAAGITFGIVTVNRKETVERFLAQHGMSGLFVFIESKHEHPKMHDKQDIIKALAKAHQTPKERTFYVSSTTDYFSYMKRFATSVGACWGFDCEENFKAQKVDHIAKQPGDLLAIFMPPAPAATDACTDAAKAAPAPT